MSIFNNTGISGMIQYHSLGSGWESLPGRIIRSFIAKQILLGMMMPVEVGLPKCNLAWRRFSYVFRLVVWSY